MSDFDVITDFESCPERTFLHDLGWFDEADFTDDPDSQHERYNDNLQYRADDLEFIGSDEYLTEQAHTKPVRPAMGMSTGECSLDDLLDVLTDGTAPDFAPTCIDVCRCKGLKPWYQEACDTCDLETAADILEAAQGRSQLRAPAASLRWLASQRR